MDIFGRAKQALESLADSAARQAEYLKLQTRMGNLKQELERHLTEVGKRARELWLMRKIRDAELDVLMQRITDIEKEMEALRQEIVKHAQYSAPGSS